MRFSAAFILATAASFVAAAPSSNPLERRADFCGDWDNVKNGQYTLYNNLWAQGIGITGFTGSQCTGLDSRSGNTLAWHTSWSWSGKNTQVKSYANAVVDITYKQLSAIKSIPTTWKWNYSGNGVVGNVAYDLFTSATAGGSEAYEIMIWVAALGGAGPISATGSPIATVSLAGMEWSLYKGKNQQVDVFSFVAKTQNKNFSGNLNDFIKYLTSKQGLPSSQYIKSIGAGSEPFVGSNAKFTTSAYTITFS